MCGRHHVTAGEGRTDLDRPGRRIRFADISRTVDLVSRQNPDLMGSASAPPSFGKPLVKCREGHSFPEKLGSDSLPHPVDVASAVGYRRRRILSLDASIDDSRYLLSKRIHELFRDQVLDRARGISPRRSTCFQASPVSRPERIAQKFHKPLPLFIEWCERVFKGSLLLGPQTIEKDILIFLKRSLELARSRYSQIAQKTRAPRDFGRHLDGLLERDLGRFGDP